MRAYRDGTLIRDPWGWISIISTVLEIFTKAEGDPLLLLQIAIMCGVETRSRLGLKRTFF